MRSYVSNRSLRCLSYNEVSRIVSTIYRHYTILWCRHLPISSNGYGFQYFTSYMANIHQQYLETNPQQKWTYCNYGQLFSTLKVCRSLARSHKSFSIINNGLKISPKKCQFFQTELVYMGLKLLIYNGRPSITPMKDKCEAIRHLDPPKTV